MDFASERYVRLYTRDTVTWKALGWEGQTVLMHVLRKLDRFGVLDIGDDPASDAIALVTGLPPEVVELGLPRLLRRGVIEAGDKCLIMGRYIEAQECVATNAKRCRDYRERQRDTKRVAIDTHSVVRDTDQHEATRSDTPYRTVPYRTYREESVKRTDSSPTCETTPVEDDDMLNALDPEVRGILEGTVSFKMLANSKYAKFWRAAEVAYFGDKSPVVLEDELRKADAWLAANPRRRPTDRGLPQFVRNWLDRAVERQRRLIQTTTQRAMRR